jgi:hypothetical protein
MANNSFPSSSRYSRVDTATFTAPDGTQAVYLKRRFVPPPENFQLLQNYTVKEGERSDNIAAQFLGDPEQFWRICDANGVMNPDDLTGTPGSSIRITLPEGIPGQKGSA